MFSNRDTAKTDQFSITIAGIYTCVVNRGVEYHQHIAKSMEFGDYDVCKTLAKVERTHQQVKLDIDNMRPRDKRCEYTLTINLKIDGAIGNKPVKSQFKNLDDLREFLEKNNLIEVEQAKPGITH